MRRRLLHSRCSALVLLSAALLTFVSGCGPLALALSVISGGKNMPAEYTSHEGLRGKRIAVVCRAPMSLDWHSARVPSQLARRVGGLIRQNIKDVEIIEARYVEDWLDKHELVDYAQVGRDLGADVVVGIDLAGFRTRENQMLLQGQADVMLRVYDLKADHGELTWEKNLPRSLFPPNGPIPAEDRLEVKFRGQFVNLLAEQVARHFYAHDATANFAISGE